MTGTRNKAKKSFTCRKINCGKSFNNAMSLHRHGKVCKHEMPGHETQSKPIITESGKIDCSTCCKAYSTPQAFSRHRKACQKFYISGKKKVSKPPPEHGCLICSKTLPTPWKLARHMETHEPKENLTCQKCSKNFMRQDFFARHVLSCVSDGGKQSEIITASSEPLLDYLARLVGPDDDFPAEYITLPLESEADQPLNENIGTESGPTSAEFQYDGLGQLDFDQVLQCLDAGLEEMGSK